MVYQINHDEVEMNNIPLITVELLADVLRSNGKQILQYNGCTSYEPILILYKYNVHYVGKTL